MGEAIKQGYLKDSELYAAWKYLNGHLTGRPVFQFTDFDTPHGKKMQTVLFLVQLLDWLKVKLEKPTFLSSLYRQFLKKESAMPQPLKRFEGDFNIADIHERALILYKYGFFEFLEFGKKLSKINHEKISSYLNSYIDLFIKDELERGNCNYFPFEAQKKKTMEMIDDHKEKFGNEFTLKFEPTNSPDNPYLFIHSIVALEKAGIIKVINAWFHDEVAPDTQTQNYKIRLICLERGVIKTPKKFQPLLYTSQGTAYLKFYKEAPKIRIGKLHTRKYRLLASCMDALDAPRLIEALFDAIKMTVDDSNSNLKEPHLALQEKIKIIKYTLKELQKIKGLTGKISLEFIDNRMIKLNLKP